MTVHRSGLITLRDQTGVGRDLPGVLKAVRIIHVGHDHFGRLAAHARNRLQELDAFVLGGQLAKSMVDLLVVFIEPLIFGQFQIEFAAPELVESNPGVVCDVG